MRTVLLVILVTTIILPASSQKLVAIINLMDSAIIHVNIGTTVFANSTEEFDLRFNPKDYVDREMERYLSGKFSTSFTMIENSKIETKDSRPSDEIYEDIFPEKLNYKDWVKAHRNEYNYILFIENRPWTDPLLNIQLKSNGLFTGGNFINHWASVYSTVYFTVYSTKTLKKINYDKSTWFYTRTIKDYEFPEENREINIAMLPIIKDRLTGLIDSRIEHFLVKTGLLSPTEYYNIKTAK